MDIHFIHLPEDKWYRKELNILKLFTINRRVLVGIEYLVGKVIKNCKLLKLFLNRQHKRVNWK